MGAMATASGRARFSNQILRRPRGVIFCISPWNFPVSTPMRKICPGAGVRKCRGDGPVPTNAGA